MATLIGEDRSRKFSIDSRQRSFIVRAATRSEYAEEIIAACGVDFGEFHPNNAGYYAKEPDVEQDSGCWWKHIVTWNYAKLTANEDPENNPEDNPLLREPEISYDTQTISIAARGEVDSDGELTKAIETSAGEPFDPAPEEDLEILIVNIVRWESPGFSVEQFYEYQNAVNSDDVRIGDLTFEEGYVKVRIRIGKREKHVANDGTITPFRQFQYTLAISPLKWDLKLLDVGTFYVIGEDEEGNSIIKNFTDEDMSIGKLDGQGGKLTAGDDPVYVTWKNKRRVPFATMNLPSGP